jgi:hypothetical protein
MEIHINARNERLSVTGLQSALSKEPGVEQSVTFTIRKPGVEFRGIDPTILVALVSTIGTGLGAVIAGLFRIAREEKSKKIIIQGRSGERLEVPADTPPDEIDHLIDRIKQLDSQVLKISLD